MSSRSCFMSLCEKRRPSLQGLVSQPLPSLRDSVSFPTPPSAEALGYTEPSRKAGLGSSQRKPRRESNHSTWQITDLVLTQTLRLNLHRIAVLQLVRRIADQRL